MPPGSTLIVEPTSSKPMSRNIMVGQVITPFWGDRWIPMKVTHMSDKPITLKKNAKLADVSPCIDMEDFEGEQVEKHDNAESTDVKQRYSRLGLLTLILVNAPLALWGRRSWSEQLEKYTDIFAKHALDCREAKGFVHCKIIIYPHSWTKEKWQSQNKQQCWLL